MPASRAQEVVSGGLTTAADELIASRVVDTSLVMLLVATPFLAPGSGSQTFVVLTVVTCLGALVIYRKGSRAQRLLRFSWVVFLTLGIAIWLAARAIDPSTHAHAVSRVVAEGTRWVIGVGFLGFALKLARARRGPGLHDAYDGAALLTVGILMVAAIAFVFFGNRLSAGALVMPAEVVGVLFLVREQFSNLQKARRMAQVAVAGAGLALLGWIVVR